MMDLKPNGTLRAFSYTAVTDLFGNTRMHKLSHGVAHCIDMDTARDMVKKLRRVESERPIVAQILIDL